MEGSILNVMKGITVKERIRVMLEHMLENPDCGCGMPAVTVVDFVNSFSSYGKRFIKSMGHIYHNWRDVNYSSPDNRIIISCDGFYECIDFFMVFVSAFNMKCKEMLRATKEFFPDFDGVEVMKKLVPSVTVGTNREANELICSGLNEKENEVWYSGLNKEENELWLWRLFSDDPFAITSCVIATIAMITAVGISVKIWCCEAKQISKKQKSQSADRQISKKQSSQSADRQISKKQSSQSVDGNRKRKKRWYGGYATPDKDLKPQKSESTQLPSHHLDLTRERLASAKKQELAYEEKLGKIQADIDSVTNSIITAQNRLKATGRKKKKTVMGDITDKKLKLPELELYRKKIEGELGEYKKTVYGLEIELGLRKKEPAKSLDKNSEVEEVKVEVLGKIEAQENTMMVT